MPFEQGYLGASPVHVAIIMDGNGRWAKSRGLPRIAGHKRGAEAVRETVRAASDLGIRHLTLFGFSTENWKRPPTEVRDLMGLLRIYLRSHIAELIKNHVRLTVIGDRSLLPEDIVTLISDAERETARLDGLHLQIALSYGARSEITKAAQRLAEEVQAGRLDPAEIDESRLEGALQTVGVPDPDLLIRTSGEKRLSNFLLWQAAYAELLFVDTLWPDFGRTQLEEAVREFQGRERRFGAATA